MKRCCKHVRIDSPDVIRPALYECFRPAKKRRRSDTRALFAHVLDISRRQADKALKERGELYHEGIERIARMLQDSIRRRDLRLLPIRQQVRIDPGSKKPRLISILGIRQLMLDHVAVYAMKELSRRIGEYQVSSIPGRGAAYGKRAIERWMGKASCKYAVKLDIKNFYGSVNKDKLMAWLAARVKNEPLLWLVRSLLHQCPKGISIGSYLSQTLANVFLSDLYHLAMERCRSKRGTRQVTHALFYMDDMLLLGANKRQLRYAAFTIMQRAGDLGLQIKPAWQVHRISTLHPVDMMGFRFSHGLTTLRKHIFKSARRALIRARRRLKRGVQLTRRLAHSLASYHGYTCSTACVAFLRRVRAQISCQTAFNYGY